MAMVERLTIIRGVEKFELQTKTARWVLAKEEGYSPVQMLVSAIGACGANAFRWYDTADQVVECKYCHSKQAFIKGMGVESAIKVVGGKEEAETDSEYQERIIHQFGLKDQVIEVKNYSLIDIPLTFIVWLYLDILLGALFICGGFLSKNYRAWYANLLRWHFCGWRYTKSATEKEKASQRIRGSLLIKWLLQEDPDKTKKLIMVGVSILFTVLFVYTTGNGAA